MRRGFGPRLGAVRAGPPTLAARPGTVPTPWCHHRLAKATQPSVGRRVLQNWLLQQPLEQKALTNTGSLKIAGFFRTQRERFPCQCSGDRRKGLKKNKVGEKKTLMKNSIGVSGWLSCISQPVAKAGGGEVAANCFADDPFNTSCLIYVSSLMKQLLPPSPGQRLCGAQRWEWEHRGGHLFICPPRDAWVGRGVGGSVGRVLLPAGSLCSLLPAPASSPGAAGAATCWYGLQRPLCCRILGPGSDAHLACRWLNMV